MASRIQSVEDTLVAAARAYCSQPVHVSNDSDRTLPQSSQLMFSLASLVPFATSTRPVSTFNDWELRAFVCQLERSAQFIKGCLNNGNRATYPVKDPLVPTMNSIIVGMLQNRAETIETAFENIVRLDPGSEVDPMMVDQLVDATLSMEAQATEYCGESLLMGQASTAYPHHARTVDSIHEIDHALREYCEDVLEVWNVRGEPHRRSHHDVKTGMSLVAMHYRLLFAPGFYDRDSRNFLRDVLRDGEMTMSWWGVIKSNERVERYMLKEYRTRERKEMRRSVVAKLKDVVKPERPPFMGQLAFLNPKPKKQDGTKK